MLYNKYRPSDFSQVKGQEHIKKVLSRQVETNTLAHSYLFVGPAGTGKTTCARILAAMINCSTGSTLTPSKEDPYVSQILAGKCSTDVYELDAASYGNIEQIRNLRDSARFAPIEMRRKIYIIDECHRLSAAAWEALLKIVEEPPEFVMFILCTTEADKVTDTIKTRSMSFEFRSLMMQDIVAEVRRIASAEGIKIGEDAIRMLAVASKGSLRQAINWLEKVKAIGVITAETIAKEIGVPSRSYARTFVNAVINERFLDSLVASSNCLAIGASGKDFLTEVCNYCHDIIIHGAKGYDMEAYGYTKEEVNEIQATKDAFKKVGILDHRHIAIEWIKVLQESINLTVFNMQPQFQVDVAFVEMHRLFRHIKPKTGA